ncbi:MAG TPA: 50S ribosomal protein L18 [Kofleriaceae bacterium]|nr:50S ribosomal protein L18 [Kofleriaceae bacterium]
MSGYTKIHDPKERSRVRRKRAIRKRLSGSAERPRLSVFRSLNHIYVQAIDDTANHVLAATSDLDKSLTAELTGKSKRDRARVVGKAIGSKLRALSVSKVVFDRNGFYYHGRVKEVADGAREAGLEL